MEETEILIVGGGLAGLCAAIQLRKLHYAVTLIEANAFPHHKVCGEYLSLEVLPYLDFLEANPSGLSPVRIAELECSLPSGVKFCTPLPLGGIGISRYALDNFLYEKALESGCRIRIDQVTDMQATSNGFRIVTRSGQVYKTQVALGAYGKRSLLDRIKNRSFLHRNADWMAVKAHYRIAEYANELVGLHLFNGGYCGVSKVEGDALNICYLMKQSSFKPYKNIAAHRKAVLYKNPELERLFERSDPVFEKPLSISQVSFARKNPVEDGVLMLGDSSRLLHPFSGNGMSAAMLSANTAAGVVHQFLKGEINREGLEDLYRSQWNRLLGNRVRAGGFLSTFIQHPWGRAVLSGLISRFPGLLSKLIQSTQGHPFRPSTAQAG